MRKEWLLLLLILAIALGLRVWGIGFGLPFSYSSDEYHEVLRALELASGRFNFERTGKGGLYFVLLLEYGLYFVLLKVLGVVDSAADFALHFVRDQTPFYLMGRWTVAIIGTVNVLAVYLLARKGYSARAGVFAAALLAINTMHVYESHTINVDIPMITLAAFVLLYALKIAQSGLPQHYYVAGLLGGLAVTTKLPAIFLTVPLFLAHGLCCRRSDVGFRHILRSRNLWLGSAIFVVVIVVTNPGIVSAFPRMVASAVGLVLGSVTIEGTDVERIIDARPNLHLYYLERLVASTGWPLVLAMAASVLYAAWKRTDADLILLSFALALYLLFTGPIAGDMYYARYLLPIIVVLVVLTGRMFDDLLAVARGRAVHVATIALAAALLVVPIYQTVIQNLALSGPDTRGLAKQWIEENVPQDARVLVEGAKISPIRTTVQLQDNLQAIERRIEYWKREEPRQAKFLEFKRQVLLEEGENSGTTYDLVLESPGELRSLEAYRAEGIEYFVLRPEALQSRRSSDGLGVTLLDELREARDVELIYTVEPELWQAVRGGGPVVEVYRLRHR